jgi:prolyl 4-hydroxylase
MESFRQSLAARSLAWMDGFLPAQTCALLIEELNFTLWRPSTVVSRYADGLLRDHPSRCRVSETSTQEWFSRELLREIRNIERRLVRLLGLPLECYEPWQATRYGVGGKFAFHNDAGHWKNDQAGERRTSVILYLQSPREGGSTRFRDLRRDVEPRAGRLLVWNNLLESGECNPRMIHSSVPVRRGTKSVLVTWIRQRPIRKNKEETTWPTRTRSSNKSSNAMER